MGAYVTDPSLYSQCVTHIKKLKLKLKLKTGFSNYLLHGDSFGCCEYRS